MSFYGIDPWIIWGIIAVVCIILEIFLPSFWMAMLSMGAIGASIAAGAGGNFGIQLAVLSVISVIAGVFFRPFAMKYIYRSSSEIPTNVDALIGKKVPVVKKIDADSTGKVKIGSEVWKALPEKEGSIFNEGDIVVVTAVDGAKVIVRSGESVE